MLFWILLGIWLALQAALFVAANNDAGSAMPIGGLFFWSGLVLGSAFFSVWHFNLWRIAFYFAVLLWLGLVGFQVFKCFVNYGRDDQLYHEGMLMAFVPGPAVCFLAAHFILKAFGK